MLTNLFSKTKPINYLILFVLLFLSYVLFQFPENNRPIFWYDYLVKILLFVILFISLFLVHFISQKNKLTKENNYAALFFLLFLIFFPSILVNSKIIIANFFILLALRRIFSMHSLKESKKKIFDAALWIFIASIFNFWSILFIVLLFMAMSYYGSRDYKNWLIPFISLLVVSIFLSVYFLISGTDIYGFFLDRMKAGFYLFNFENLNQDIALFTFSAFSALIFISQLIDLPKKTFNKQILYKKILVTFMIGASVYIMSVDENNASLVFTFFPLAILGANYIENKPTLWFKETILWSIIVICLSSYISQFLY